jgi:hypothetical protein
MAESFTVPTTSATSLGHAPNSTQTANNTNNSYTTTAVRGLNNLANILLPAIQIPGSTAGRTGSAGTTFGITNVLQVNSNILVENYGGASGTSYRTIIDNANIHLGWTGSQGPTAMQHGPEGYIGNINLLTINGITFPLKSTSSIDISSYDADATVYPLFSTAMGAGQTLYADNAGNTGQRLTYNPSTGSLTTTNFLGTATNANNVLITSNADNVEHVVPFFVEPPPPPPSSVSGDISTLIDPVTIPYLLFDALITDDLLRVVVSNFPGLENFFYTRDYVGGPWSLPVLDSTLGIHILYPE